MSLDASAQQTAESRTSAANLSDFERSELSRLEAKIDDGFRAIGEALAHIKAKGLYREYGTWDDYCETRWNRTRRWATYYINAAQAYLVITENANNCSQGLPTSESVLRSIATLPDEQIKTIWNKAVEQFGDSPTAQQVKQVRDVVLNKPAKSDTPALDAGTKLLDEVVVDDVPEEDTDSDDSPDPDAEIKRQVYDSGLLPIYQRMTDGEYTPKVALTLCDAISSCEPKVRGQMIRLDARDPAFIREMNRLHKSGSNTYTEIVATGYLQFEEEAQAVAVVDARLVDLRRLLDEKMREYRRAGALERDIKKGIQPVVTTIYRGSWEKTLEVLKRELPADELSQIARALLT